MFKEITVDNKKELINYVTDIFGNNIMSFFRVQKSNRVDVYILRSIKKNTITRWDSLFIEVTPHYTKTWIHYVNGLYSIIAYDENEFKHYINSWKAPKMATFIGGVHVPSRVQEFYYLDALHEMLMVTHDSITAIDMRLHNGYIIPYRAVIAHDMLPQSKIIEPIIRRSLYENGIPFKPPASLLVDKAPPEYYFAYTQLVL